MGKHMAFSDVFLNGHCMVTQIKFFSCRHFFSSEKPLRPQERLAQSVLVRQQSEAEEQLRLKPPGLGKLPSSEGLLKSQERKWRLECLFVCLLTCL